MINVPNGARKGGSGSGEVSPRRRHLPWFLEKWPDVQGTVQEEIRGQQRNWHIGGREGMPRRQMPPNTAVRRMGCCGEL